MNKFVVTLEDSDLLELQVILMDRDEKAALEFLKTRLAPRIPKRGNAPCDSSRLNPYLLTPESGKTK